MLHFFQQAPLAVTLPYIPNPAVGSDQHEMRNFLYPITHPKPGISVYKFVPLVSDQLLFGNKLLPHRLRVLADAHNRNPAGILSCDLLQFGNRLYARTAARTPEIEQNIFPDEFRQAMQIPIRIVQITIPQDMIGAVIGPGGKVIQDIQKTTGTTITITEVDNKGIVDIFGQDKTALDGALNRIKAIVAIPEIGETYHGKIRSIVTFGAFVEIMPGKDALLHISEIDYKRFETMEETGLKEGDEIDVKLIGMDPKTNKLKLSRKVLLPKPEGYVERERRPRGERPERGERHERHGRPERKEE